MQISVRGQYSSCFVVLCTLIAACGGQREDEAAPPDARQAADALPDGGADMASMPPQEWFVLDLSAYQDGDRTPLIASHQTALVFPMDLSEPRKVVTEPSASQLLEIQTKTPCGVSAEDNVVAALERQVIGANVRQGDATHLQRLHIYMPYATVPDDGFRRGPGRVCFGFHAHGKWVWRMSFVQPALNDEAKMGVAHIDVQEDGVDQIAVLFHETSHVGMIGMEVGATSMGLRRWGVPPSRSISGGVVAASGDTLATVGYFEKDFPPGQSGTWLTVQSVSSDGRRMAHAVTTEVAPSAGSLSIASDGQRFVLCMTSPAVSCFLQPFAGAKLMPVFHTVESAARVAVIKARTGWVVAWSMPQTSEASNQLVLQALDENFQPVSRIELPDAIGGDFPFRWFKIAATNHGFALLSGAPVVLRYLDSDLRPQGTLSLGLPPWHHATVVARGEDAFVSVAKPYGATLLRIRDRKIADTWHIEGGGKVGAQTMFGEGASSAQAFWWDFETFKVQELHSSQPAFAVQAIVPHLTYQEAAALVNMRDQKVVVTNTPSQLSLLVVP